MIGRQRYETLLRFNNNKLKLKNSGLKILKDWANKTYEEIAPNLKTIFKGYKLKIIYYTIENVVGITDEDIDRLGRDIFRRHNYGNTALKPSELERALYCYDLFNCRLGTHLKSNEDLYEKCIDLFLNNNQKESPDRERINYLLITIRELISMLYIPIIGEKKIGISLALIEKYYNKFIKQYTDKEQKKKIEEFSKIINKIYTIKEKLTDINSKLQDNIQLFKSIYWMFSILYNFYSTKFYEFNVDKFCHYLENGGYDYFDKFGRKAVEDLEKRNSYMKEYLNKELNIDITQYIENTKENKKAIIYKRDKNISKDKDWINSNLTKKFETKNDTIELKEIRKLIKERRFVIQNDYQRGEIVEIRKASRLIESVILGEKIPPIYLYEEEYPIGSGVYKSFVLDGQQRLLNLLTYIGVTIRDQNNNEIKTKKQKYALQGLTSLRGLKSTYEELSDVKKEKIDDLVLDVVKINKIGNENINYADIFIRINENPSTIDMNSFSMWNSFEIRDSIRRIKEIAKYKGFKQFGNKMKEEELVTILSYMAYKEFTIKDIGKFFNVKLSTYNKDSVRENTHIKISIKNKYAVTNFLEMMRPKEEKEQEFLKSIEKVTDFVEKLKILSNNDEKEIIKVFNPYKTNNRIIDKNALYIAWLILQELDIHVIQTYKEEILKDLTVIFKEMQNMPKGKNENDFVEHVGNIIKKHRK